MTVAETAPIADLNAEAAAAGISMPPKEEAPAVERPANIPEKFWDAEKGEVRVDAMAQSYTELESARGSSNEPADPEAEAAPGEAAPEGEADPAAEQAREAVEGAGLDFGAMSTEFADTGELSEETLVALEKGGIPREITEQYLSGVQAQGDALRGSIMDAAGGEEGYTGLISWASESDAISEADASAFNEAVNSGNANAARMAIAGMMARKTADVGSDPARVIGGKPNASAGDVYGSSAEVSRDMNNPLYASDPAFRQKVIDKLSRSPDI